MMWDALAVFAAVADARSFTAGARRLGLPKSTVSRQVSTLEEELDAQLLYRTTRSVRLTPAGRRLLDRVGPHVAALGRVHPGDLSSQPEGVLRITSVPDLGTTVLSEVVARYVTLYPRVKVETAFTVDVVDLIADGFDLALRVAGKALPDDPHLQARRVGSIRMGLYASQLYLNRAGSPSCVEELRDHTVFSLGGGQRLIDLSIPARVASDDVGFISAALRTGAGIGVLPDLMAREQVSAGLLQRVLPEVTLWTGQVWLVTAQSRTPPPRVTAFTELVHSVLEQTGALTSD